MSTQTKAREAQHSEPLEWSARVGFAAYGLVYLILAWLTAQLALSHPDKSVSRQGALHALAGQPLGEVVLWVAAAGFAALVIWQACSAVAGYRDREGAKRVLGRLGAAFRGVVFATLAFTTAQVAIGARASGQTRSQGLTARVMSWPLGPWLVSAVGIGIVAYAGYSAVRGLTDRWRREIDPEGQQGTIGAGITATARIGYVGRALAFAVIGCLLVWAALTHDPHHSGGLDRSLAKVREAPFGVVLLIAIAVGFACYGVFNLAKAWQLRSS